MNFLKSRSRSRRNSASVMTASDKWKTSNRKISRRGNELIEEDSGEDEPHYKEIKDWVTEFFERKSTCQDKMDQDVEVQLTKKQTLLLATLVPDEILLMDKFDKFDPKRFVGVLLMADVSGFTALSERYSNSGKGGTYRLTATLNTYLGSLIEIIYSHGGDIIKFAGDAFLALWKTDKRTFLCHTIHTVIACALIIQHSYGSYETDVKVNLRVKLAISAGNLIFAPVGSGIDLNYIILGLPVMEAKAAESVCVSGEVKLSPTAWGHCYSRNYDHIITEDGYVTIKSILYDPHESDVTKPFVGFGNMVRQIKKTFNAIEDLPDSLWDTSKDMSIANILKRNETLSLRKSILLAEERNIGSEIRKFMIRPVLTQIDAHQPLEYLTEMRQVSILFITLKPRRCSYSQLITIVTNSYEITCEIVLKSMGCVNKIILFDKDVMILVVFGLRGFKHESEAQAALKCAYNIKKSVSVLDGVLEVSIGVTTGQVYCGVVGHPLRREFTVIGATVNKAARLMCGFRNKITCDETTFVKSKMSSNGFTLQPRIELKGIRQPGKIYEYTEEIRVKELYDIPMIPPLLDRIDEMEYFQSWLEESELTYRDFDALLLVGESRIGKSRMLEWMARHAKNSEFGVCSINLTSVHSATTYLALSQIINQILGLKEPITGFAKEEKIVQMLKTYSEDLCYLNNIIKVRFAYHEGIYSQNESKRIEKGKVIFTKLIKAISDPYVVFLDDLQNLDSLSWEFISLMFSSLKIFMVLSVTRGKFSAVHNWLYSAFICNSIRKISLGPLTSEWIPPLACQILDVNAVPKDLCNALQTKCKGMPGLIESFIIHLFSSGAIEIKRIQAEEINEWKEKEELHFPKPDLLHPQALNATEQAVLDQLILNDDKGELTICTVTRKEELNTNINVLNIDALIMIQIDSLTPYQQLLLKIASVIGSVIPRTLLENIMYENNTMTTAKAVKRLFAMKILSCANADIICKYNRKTTSTINLGSTTNTNLFCECCFDYDPEEYVNLPKYAFCKLMKFRNKNSRKTCYELLPLNQKKEFHSRIVNYLENNKQKCTDCGGTIMIVQSILSLQTDEIRQDTSNSSTEIVVPKDNNSASQSESEEDISKENIHRESSNKLHTSIDVKRVKSESVSSRKESKAMKSSIESNRSVKSSLQFTPILKTKSTSEDTVEERKTSKRVTMTNLHFKRFSSEEIDNYKIYEMLRTVTEAESLQDWEQLGIIDSQASMEPNIYLKSFSIKIHKGVSQTNFAKCTCAVLNITICEQLVHHAQKADLKSKAIEFLIKYSYLSILNNITENVFDKLQQAEKMCYMNNIDLDNFNRKRFLGKIFSLRAAANLLSRNLPAAKLEIERATNIYQVNLHKVTAFLKLRDIMMFLNFQRRKLHKLILKSDSVFCLNVATMLYSTLGEQIIARMTAIRALNIIRDIECAMIDICDTYSNAIQVELDRGTPDNTADIEQMAAQCLKRLPHPIQADELYAVGKLLMATFRARMARGELLSTMLSGFKALSISRFLQADDISIDIIPDLFYILLTRRRIQEAVDIVKLPLRLCQNRVSSKYETWYYAMCIDMILDAGFQLEPPHEISRYAEYSLVKGKSAGASRRRLVVGLWTYWLRADSEKKAKRFEFEALSWTSNIDDGSLTTLLSSMRLAEGMLESLARKVEDLRKVVDLMELRSIADRELARLEEDARLLRAIHPRWLLLKANSFKLSGRHAAATTHLSQALEEACRINNRLEESMARAAVSSSVFWQQSARAGVFVHWRAAAEQANTSWHELMYKITTTRCK